jgi:hypothetical protein
MTNVGNSRKSEESALPSDVEYKDRSAQQLQILELNFNSDKNVALAKKSLTCCNDENRVEKNYNSVGRIIQNQTFSKL